MRGPTATSSCTAVAKRVGAPSSAFSLVEPMVAEWERGAVLAMTGVRFTVSARGSIIRPMICHKGTSRRKYNKELILQYKTTER